MKSKILLLHADGTQALPFAKSLNRQGYQVGGVFLAKSSYGYYSRFIDKKYIYKGNMKDLDCYFAFVKRILEKEEKLATAAITATAIVSVVTACAADEKNYNNNPDDPFATATIITKKHSKSPFCNLYLY